MDNQQSKLVEQYQDAKLRKQLNDDDELDVNSSDDELLELLEQEDNDVLSKYRDERMQQLKKEFARIDNATNRQNFGSVISIDDEKDLMDTVTHNEYTLVHFYQDAFAKCNKMNQKLRTIAEKHLTVKVIIIEAKKAPFLVAKLGIKVLPFVAIYRNGKEIDRIVGFERLGNDPNDFKIEDLEALLLQKNVINRTTINFGSVGRAAKVADDDSDLDL